MLTSSLVASLCALRMFVIAIAVICVLAPSSYAAKKQGFTSFIVGNAADAQPSATLSPGLVLMGGGKRDHTITYQ